MMISLKVDLSITVQLVEGNSMSKSGSWVELRVVFNLNAARDIKVK